MLRSLHDANKSASRTVYTGQLAFCAGINQDSRMKMRLKSLRNARSMTIDQLAEISGLSKGYISLLENNKRQPSSEVLTVLSQSLKVKITELIDEGELPYDLDALLGIMSALSEEDRREVVRDAAARLRRASA